VIGLASAYAGGVRGIGPTAEGLAAHGGEGRHALGHHRDLSRRWIWPSVWKDNSDIKNPHRISPGERSLIPRPRCASDHAEVAQIALELDAPARSGQRRRAGRRRLPSRWPWTFAALIRATTTPWSASGLHRFGYLTPQELSGTAAVLGSHDENYWIVAGAQDHRRRRGQGPHR
jgi:hypothetical protein